MSYGLTEPPHEEPTQQDFEEADLEARAIAISMIGGDVRQTQRLPSDFQVAAILAFADAHAARELERAAERVEDERAPDEEPDPMDLDPGYDSGLRDAAQIVRARARELRGEG